jgi:uncharacterized protein YjbI with pentapeptide repeats
MNSLYTHRLLRLFYIGIFSLSFTIIFQVFAQKSEQNDIWIGHFYDGTRITVNDLYNILDKHKKYLLTQGAEGQIANLDGADLSEIDLSKANLSGAYMVSAKLSGANLKGADLTNAKLNGADLKKATLTGAKLVKANLSNVYLVGANLNGTDMKEITLSGANLSGAKLKRADLSGAYLLWAKLNGADLVEANLTESDLSGADLSGAYLSKAILKNAKLKETILKGIDFIGVEGLSEIRIINPDQIIEVRKVAKYYGFKNEERAITSALRKYQLKSASFFEKYFQRFVLGGEITDYGANPWASFVCLGTLIIPFSICYIVFLIFDIHKTGIYVLIPKEIVQNKNVGQKPIKLHRKKLSRKIFSRACKGHIYRSFRLLRISIYFSLLSAFSIGWREFNIGNWIVRLQRRDYTLQGIGWARTVSGLQSLISLYFFILWALTYFGRPFE